MHVLPLDRTLKLFEKVRAANLKSVPYPLPMMLAFDSRRSPDVPLCPAVAPSFSFHHSSD